LRGQLLENKRNIDKKSELEQRLNTLFEYVFSSVSKKIVKTDLSANATSFIFEKNKPAVINDDPLRINP